MANLLNEMKLPNNITGTNNDTSVIGEESLLDMDITKYKPFKYAHMGSMASVGDWKAVLDTGAVDAKKNDYIPPLKGFLAFAVWRAAYWTKSVSWTNKMLIPMYWFKSAVFGRDISRF